MKVYGVVYLIWNKVNGKRYVGQTIQPLKRRFKNHVYANTAIGNAMRKYGLENFHYGVIKSCASKEEMDYWEIFFIAALKSKFPYGYNRSEGGEGGIPCDETRAKMSASQSGENNPNYGKHASATTCAKISAAMSGENHPYYGKHRPVATCAKIGIAHRGYSPFKNLLAEIDARQFSYRSLAKLIGVSDMTVSSKMRCKQKFTAKEIKKLEEIFGKPAEYLLQRDD